MNYYNTRVGLSEQFVPTYLKSVLKTTIRMLHYSTAALSMSCLSIKLEHVAISCYIYIVPV